MVFPSQKYEHKSSSSVIDRLTDRTDSNVIERHTGMFYREGTLSFTKLDNPIVTISQASVCVHGDGRVICRDTEGKIVKVPNNYLCTFHSTDGISLSVSQDGSLAGRHLKNFPDGLITTDDCVTTLLKYDGEPPITLPGTTTRINSEGIAAISDSHGTPVPIECCAVSCTADGLALQLGRGGILQSRIFAMTSTGHARMMEASNLMQGFSLNHVLMASLHRVVRLAIASNIRAGGFVTLVDHCGNQITASENVTCMTPDETYFYINSSQRLCRSEACMKNSSIMHMPRLTAVIVRSRSGVQVEAACSAKINCNTGKVVVRDKFQKLIEADICITLKESSGSNIIVGPDGHVVGKPIFLRADGQISPLPCVKYRSKKFKALLVAAAIPENNTTRQNCVFAILTSNKCYLIDSQGFPLEFVNTRVTVIFMDGSCAFISAEGVLSGLELATSGILKNCCAFILNSEGVKQSIEHLNLALDAQSGKIEVENIAGTTILKNSMSFIKNKSNSLILSVGLDGFLCRPVLVPDSNDRIQVLGQSCFNPLSASSEGKCSTINAAIVVLPSDEILIGVSVVVDSKGRATLIDATGFTSLLPPKSFVTNPFGTFVSVATDGHVTGRCINVSKDKKTATLKNAKLSIFSPRGGERKFREVQIKIDTKGVVAASTQEDGKPIFMNGIGVARAEDETKIIIDTCGHVIGKTIILGYNGNVLVMGSDKNHKYDLCHKPDQKEIMEQALSAGIAYTSNGSKVITYFGSALIVTSSGRGYIFRADGELIPVKDTCVIAFQDGTTASLRSKSRYLTGQHIESKKLLNNKLSHTIIGCKLMFTDTDNNIKIQKDVTLMINEDLKVNILDAQGENLSTGIHTTATDPDGTILTINKYGFLEGRALTVDSSNQNLIILGRERCNFTSYISYSRNLIRLSSAIISLTSKKSKQVTYLGARVHVLGNRIAAYSSDNKSINLPKCSTIITADGILLFTSNHKSNCLATLDTRVHLIAENVLRLEIECVLYGNGDKVATESAEFGLNGEITIGGKIVKGAVIIAVNGCKYRVGLDGFLIGRYFFYNGFSFQVIGQSMHQATTILGTNGRATILHSCLVIIGRKKIQGATVSISAEGLIAIFDIEGSVEILNTKAVIVAADGTRAFSGDDGVLLGSSFDSKDEYTFRSVISSISIMISPSKVRLLKEGMLHVVDGKIRYSKNGINSDLRGSISVIRPVDGPTLVCRPDGIILGQVLIKPLGSPVTLIFDRDGYALTKIDTSGGPITQIRSARAVTDNQGLEVSAEISSTDRIDICKSTKYGETQGALRLTLRDGSFFSIDAHGLLKSRSLPGLRLSSEKFSFTAGCKEVRTIRKSSQSNSKRTSTVQAAASAADMEPREMLNSDCKEEKEKKNVCKMSLCSADRTLSDNLLIQKNKTSYLTKSSIRSKSTENDRNNLKQCVKPQQSRLICDSNLYCNNGVKFPQDSSIFRANFRSSVPINRDTSPFVWSSFSSLGSRLNNQRLNFSNDEICNQKRAASIPTDFI